MNAPEHISQAPPSGRLETIFRGVRYLSMKHDSYFQVYEHLLERFVGQPITFVEVGVLNGGSLFMWREYFGPQARIIGVEYNEGAVRWREHGFEIHIGDQGDPAFWKAFFAAVGPVDVLLDDGGHTNQQQIVTAASAFPNVRDGGLVIVEDTHASYLPEFGNPSEHSFMRWTQHVVDSVASRSGTLKQARNGYWRHVYTVEIFESIVAFRIERARCTVSRVQWNGGESVNAEDLRLLAESPELYRLERTLAPLGRIILLKSIKKRLIRLLYRRAARRRLAQIQTYFD